MKIATIIVRILFGLLYTFSAAVVLFNLMPQPEIPPGNIKTFMDGMMATGYLMTLLKVTELVCGLALITGFFAPLANVIIFPITLNILCFHLFTAKADVGMAIVMLLMNLFLAYAYREKYKPMLTLK